MKTGSMVVKVSDKEISTKEMKTGEITSIPYGMALWSTGIGTRPVIKDFMMQVGQVCYCSSIKPDAISQLPTCLCFLQIYLPFLSGKT